MEKKNFNPIFINDNFSLDSDRYSWILVQSYDGKDKQGVSTRQIRKTYYGNIRQVCTAILDKSSKECKTSKEIIELFDNAVEKLIPEMNKLVGVN